MSVGEALPPNAVHPKSRAEWRRWLGANHTRTEGVWLVSYKKAANRPDESLTYDEVVEEALCVGWVDSKPRALDEQRTMLWFAPRKAGTGWSAPNKARVAKLVAAKLMKTAGLAKVAAAKADGSWAKLDAVEALVTPPDLTAALKQAGKAAQTNWQAFPRSAKRGILEWIEQAKRAETRAARVADTAEKAARNERANQWRKA